jgi:DNA-directed RNA polymerase subunit N (RpoN/RPB10)
MAQAVRCDICGKLFSSSYVGSHKRLAHSKSDQSAGEQQTLQKILKLFKDLSQEGKKKALDELRAIAGRVN